MKHQCTYSRHDKHHMYMYMCAYSYQVQRSIIEKCPLTLDSSRFHVRQALFLTLKVFFIPLLYNAILLVNASLADPFGGEVNDFPKSKYERGIESDGLSYVQAGEHLPMWMA